MAGIGRIKQSRIENMKAKHPSKDQINRYAYFTIEDHIWHFRGCFKNRHGINAGVLRQLAKDHLAQIRLKRK
jgi:hypothetical protein